MSNMNKMVKPHNYIKWVTLTFGITAGLIFIIMLLGPKVRAGKGEATWDEYRSAVLNLSVGLVAPVLFVFLANMSAIKWRELSGTKIVLWHMVTAITCVVITCIITISWLGYEVILADYEKPIFHGLGVESVDKPYEMAMSARVQRICTYCGVFLSFFLSLEMFYKPKVKSARAMT